MLVSVEFRLRQRQIPLAVDSPPRYDLPEVWQEDSYRFGFETQSGIQQIPGEIDAVSAVRRHVSVIAPREWVDADQPATWPTFTLAGVTHQIGGPLLITDPVDAGLVVYNGGVNPPARTFFVEAEEMAKVGKWRGGWRSLFWRW